ncbi:MAG: DegT/DnrJ/EryC1/StrS family aminotransferase [bacterium]|nr:DegT/DnrJ/EryC1/StrS family aminotransferase [bacterium]
MRTDIYPYTNTSVRTSRKSEEELDALLTEYFGVETAVTSSARSGLYIILKQLGLGRTDHVLVPDFLCRSVLYIINLLGFAVQEPNVRTKAVFVFHQWGYPQRMDVIMEEAKKRGWLVVEDCAHTFGSTYRGQVVGSFGDAAIISFAKFFPTYVGGAVISKRKDIIARVRDTRGEPRSLRHRVFDRMSVRAAKLNYLFRKPPFLLTAIYMKSIHFPRIARIARGRFPATLEHLKSDIARRKYIFQMLKKKAGPEYHPVHLDEDCDVIPLCVPIFFPEHKLKAAQEMLNKKNIVVDILHFDVNRNALNPQYKKCLAFPCHQRITDEELTHMCEVIERV